MGIDDFALDLETQRFLINRWETEEGKSVLKLVLERIKSCSEIRSILDDYVLDCPENSDPYAYPMFPKEKMREKEFWVLTHDDLRGIVLFNEDFSNSKSLEKKNLEYSSFFGCIFSNTDLQRTDLSYCKFIDCDMKKAFLAGVGARGATFKNCSLQSANFFNSSINECHFINTDLTQAFFGNAVLENLDLDYLTLFDYKLKLSDDLYNMSMALEELPDLYKAIRVGYEKAEIWNQMDIFLYQEKKAQRKYILFRHFLKSKSITDFKVWLNSYISNFLSGYSTKPFRVIINSIVMALIFTFIYFFLGLPVNDSSEAINLFDALNLSFGSFTGNMYSDLSYDGKHPFMRILYSSETFLGVVYISLFVVVLARKIFR
ncbi:TPA: voltage-gated potassium channel [Legionella pneumophila]|nr:voltage-gated potassium channel [Legionella pneumophila]HAU1656714.1 pentapeptide repeat-containing protein [Legionella pneumophila]